MKCFVKNCSSNEQLFPPFNDDPNNVQNWKDALPKRERQFNPLVDKVCRLHFPPRMLKERMLVLMTSGVPSIVPVNTSGQWTLLPGAYPTIFKQDVLDDGFLNSEVTVKIEPRSSPDNCGNDGDIDIKFQTDLVENVSCMDKRGNMSQEQVPIQRKSIISPNYEDCDMGFIEENELNILDTDTSSAFPPKLLQIPVKIKEETSEANNVLPVPTPGPSLLVIKRVPKEKSLDESQQRISRSVLRGGKRSIPSSSKNDLDRRKTSKTKIEDLSKQYPNRRSITRSISKKSLRGREIPISTPEPSSSPPSKKKVRNPTKVDNNKNVKKKYPFVSATRRSLLSSTQSTSASTTTNDLEAQPRQGNNSGILKVPTQMTRVEKNSSFTSTSIIASVSVGTDPGQFNLPQIRRVDASTSPIRTFSSSSTSTSSSNTFSSKLSTETCPWNYELNETPVNQINDFSHLESNDTNLPAPTTTLVHGSLGTENSIVFLHQLPRPNSTSWTVYPFSQGQGQTQNQMDNSTAILVDSALSCNTNVSTFEDSTSTSTFNTENFVVFSNSVLENRKQQQPTFTGDDLYMPSNRSKTGANSVTIKPTMASVLATTSFSSNSVSESRTATAPVYQSVTFQQKPLTAAPHQTSKPITSTAHKNFATNQSRKKLNPIHLPGLAMQRSKNPAQKLIAVQAIPDSQKLSSGTYIPASIVITGENPGKPSLMSSKVDQNSVLPKVVSRYSNSNSLMKAKLSSGFPLSQFQQRLLSSCCSTQESVSVTQESSRFSGDKDLQIIDLTESDDDEGSNDNNDTTAVGLEFSDIDGLFGLRSSLHLPDNTWSMFMLSNERCVIISQIVFKVDKSGGKQQERTLKIKEDLKFEIFVKGMNITRWFNPGDEVLKTVVDLQELINNLSNVNVCGGIEGFTKVPDILFNLIGRKTGDVWFSMKCEQMSTVPPLCSECRRFKDILLSFTIKSVNLK